MDVSQFDPRLLAVRDCLYRVAAKALIVRDGRLLLSCEGHHGRMAALKFRSLPGGGIDYGEDFRTGLRRELSEEVALDVRLDQISAEPLRLSFGVLADGVFAGGKNIPTLIAYFAVDLDADQMPVERANNFEWVDAAGLSAANFVSQTAIDRQFLSDYLAGFSQA